MSLPKKLRQATFRVVPPWVNCLSITSTGELLACESSANDLERNERRFWCPMMDRQCLILDDGYDRTDWDHSAIDRWQKPLNDDDLTALTFGDI